MEESKKNAFHRLHNHYKANVVAAEIPSISATSSTAEEEPEWHDLPVTPIDDLEDDNGSDQDLPVYSLEELDDVRDDIKSKALDAYARLDKGTFINFIITVLCFQWGHIAKLRALKNIDEGKAPQTQEELLKALSMHRFMPFMTWQTRDETNSIKHLKKEMSSEEPSETTVPKA